MRERARTVSVAPMTTLRALAAALLAAALLPAAAHANATVAKTTPEIVYQGTDAVDDISVLLNNPPAIIFQAAGSTLIDAGANCSGVVGQEHTRVACQPGSATINLAGGDDRVLGGSDSHGMTFNGGAGSDTLNVGSTAINRVNGGDGNDSIMAYGINRDEVDGGDGDDLIRGVRGPDDVKGGAGTDRLEVLASAPVTISLDDVANDGEGAGSANVHADVEQLAGGAEADTFTGSAAANGLSGGQGADTLDGGGGADTILGGEGDDTISARDGVADTIDCGVGDDTVTVDALDAVTGCETVIRPDDDLDGSPAPIDCDDHDPAVHPGAGDTPGDGIDQDCSGADAPAPPAPAGGARTQGGGAKVAGGAATAPAMKRIEAPVRNRWLVKRGGTRVTAFAVRRAPAGARVTVTCAGRGCPFATRSRQVPANGRAGFTALLKGHRLKPGVVIEIRITAAGAIGKVVRYKVRRGKLPRAQTRCLAPGTSTGARRC